jgi:hypothetical protein
MSTYTITVHQRGLGGPGPLVRVPQLTALNVLTELDFRIARTTVVSIEDEQGEPVPVRDIVREAYLQAHAHNEVPLWERTLIEALTVTHLPDPDTQVSPVSAGTWEVAGRWWAEVTGVEPSDQVCSTLADDYPEHGADARVVDRFRQAAREHLARSTDIRAPAQEDRSRSVHGPVRDGAARDGTAADATQPRRGPLPGQRSAIHNPPSPPPTAPRRQ